MALVAVPSDSGRGPDFSFAWERPEFNDRRLQLRVKRSAVTEVGSDSSKRKRKRGSVSGDAVVEEKEVRVSTILLSEKCDFFRVMLTSGLRESEAGAPIVLELAEEEEAPFMELLRYVYHGSLSPGHCAIDKVRDLLALLVVGDKYGCQSIQTAVWDVLKALETLDLASSDAVIDWYKGMRWHEDAECRSLRRDLYFKAIDFLLKRFTDVERDWSSEDFFSLSKESVEYLLSFEDLEAESEEEIFERLVLWVQRTQVGKERRMGVLRDMATSIRFATMTGESLQSLLKRPILQKLVDTIMEAVWWRASSMERRLVLDRGRERRTREGIIKRRQRSHEIRHSFALPDLDREEGLVSESGVATFDGIQWVLGIHYAPSSDYLRDGLSLFLRAVEHPFLENELRRRPRRMVLHFGTVHHPCPNRTEITFEKQTHTFRRGGASDEVRLENPFKQPYWSLSLRSSDFTDEEQLTVFVRFSISQE